MYAPVPALMPGANRPSLNLVAQSFKPLQPQELLILQSLSKHLNATSDLAPFCLFAANPEPLPHPKKFQPFLSGVKLATYIL